MRAIDQHKATLSILALASILSFVVVISEFARGSQSFLPWIALLAGLIFGALFWVEQRGWIQARVIGVGIITVFVGVAVLLDATPRIAFVPSVFLPPLLALIMTRPAVIAASGIGTLLFPIIGFGVSPANPYLNYLTLLGTIMVIAGMVFARLVLDVQQQRAEAATTAAHHAQARAEAEARTASERADALKQQTDEQRRLLDLVTQLETPAIALADGVLLAPIVGSLDSRRAALLTTKLLHEVARQRAYTVIVDVTSVAAVDTQVARVLLDLVAALRLLGCQVTLTGISASVAITLTHLGITLDTPTARTPQEALQRNADQRALRLQSV